MDDAPNIMLGFDLVAARVVSSIFFGCEFCQVLPAIDCFSDSLSVLHAIPIYTRWACSPLVFTVFLSRFRFHSVQILGAGLLRSLFGGTHPHLMQRLESINLWRQHSWHGIVSSC
jgi:hypothetical protein